MLIGRIEVDQVAIEVARCLVGDFEGSHGTLLALPQCVICVLGARVLRMSCDDRSILTSSRVSDIGSICLLVIAHNIFLR